MATYKVIQDIEAEDKLVGPLTLRQFIYAGITALCLYICFISIAKHVAFLIALFLPPGILTGFFAYPFRRDQPTEIWALAKIRFLFKPRRRVWDQSGIKELVTITAPKRIETDYTNGLTQTEVKSRLHALADTIDSRGWAIKNVDVNLYSPPAALASAAGSTDSDRLIGPSSLPQDVPSVDVTASDDMLDEQNSPIAQQFNSMLNKSSQAHRQQVMQEMDNARTGATLPPPVLPSTPPAGSSPAQPPNDYWFLNQPAGLSAAHSTNGAQVITPGISAIDDHPVAAAEPSEAEKALAEHLRQQNQSQNPQVAYPHLHTIMPLSEQKQAAVAQPPAPQSPVAAMPPTPAAAPVTPSSDPATLNYANNNDLTVATIARQVNKSSDDESPDEVVISLH